jgi:hypothetical protein
MSRRRKLARLALAIAGGQWRCGNSSTSAGSLERSTKAGGQDRIDHPRHGHDDIANAVAGALVFAYSGSTYSAQQSFRDNAKMAAAYKKWARAVA